MNDLMRAIRAAKEAQKRAPEAVAQEISELTEGFPERIRCQKDAKSMLGSLMPLVNMLHVKAWISRHGTSVPAMKDACSGLEHELSDYPSRLQGVAAKKALAELDPLIQVLRAAISLNEMRKGNGANSLRKGDEKSHQL